MSEGKRRHRPAAERREQLLDAAVEVMGDGGIGALTTRAVTARAGLPHGSFHYCFRSKEDLLLALLERELDGSMRQAWAAVGGAADPESGIAAGLGGYLDHVRADPERQLLLSELTLAAARTPSMAHLPRWEHEQYVAHVEVLLREWTVTAALTWTVPIEVLAELLTAGASGLGASWLSTRDDNSISEAAQVLGRALAGLALR
jgi:AcrR family transcriptional regulator